MIEDAVHPVVLLGWPGWQELLLILVIVLLIFGGSKLTGIGRGLGEGIRSFRQGLKGESSEKDDTPTPENKG
jgi:sec-independent protein translocase protein TatA